MEMRKLFKQGKSCVLVIPTKYLKALDWAQKDFISLSLMPDKTLSLRKIDSQNNLNLNQKEL